MLLSDGLPDSGNSIIFFFLLSMNIFKPVTVQNEMSGRACEGWAGFENESQTGRGIKARSADSEKPGPQCSCVM